MVRFIGSHVCVALLSAGERIVVFDNFRHSSPEALVAIAIMGFVIGLTGRRYPPASRATQKTEQVAFFKRPVGFAAE